MVKKNTQNASIINIVHTSRFFTLHSFNYKCSMKSAFNVLVKFYQNNIVKPIGLMVNSVQLVNRKGERQTEANRKRESDNVDSSLPRLTSVFLHL